MFSSHINKMYYYKLVIPRATIVSGPGPLVISYIFMVFIIVIWKFAYSSSRAVLICNSVVFTVEVSLFNMLPPALQSLLGKSCTELCIS